MADRNAPYETQLSIEEARRLLTGDLGDAYRALIKGSCAPLLWHRPENGRAGRILHNGTITFVRTPERLLGVTAAHVVRQYQADHAEGPVLLQAGDAALRAPSIVDISPDVDLATFAITERDLSAVGKDVTPLSAWPPMLPQEECGILLGGYPAQERLQTAPGEANWGLFTALGISRTVINGQITWRVDREWGSGDLPINADLGGASGGPLIGLFSSNSGLQHHRLSGIISEASSSLEAVTAVSAEFIRPDGKIRRR